MYNFDLAQGVYHVAKSLGYNVQSVRQSLNELECYVLLKPFLSNNTCYAIVELALRCN